MHVTTTRTGIGESSPPPPSPKPGAASDESARAALAHRESPGRRLLRLVVLLIAVGVLVKGWVVTDIDLGRLANAPNAVPILRALASPDVVARDLTQVELQTDFVVSSTQ